MTLELQLENERLRWALEFYANPESWECNTATNYCYGCTEANDDSGKLAKQALQAPSVSPQALLEVIGLAKWAYDDEFEKLSPEAVALFKEFGSHSIERLTDIPMPDPINPEHFDLSGDA